eukprot:13412908-Alexandrium_andersonii.AAC.1
MMRCSLLRGCGGKRLECKGSGEGVEGESRGRVVAGGGTERREAGTRKGRGLGGNRRMLPLFIL